MLHGVEHGENADPVTDEVRGILAINNPFAQATTAEFSHVGKHFRVGLIARDQLQQTHVARRIKEMSNKEVLTYRLRQHCGHGVN